MKKTLLGLMLVAALGASASTFSVSNSTSGTTTAFTITRSGEGTNAAETVYYRTVSRSGLAGVHFANAEGSINFTARQLSKTVPVEEFSASQFSGSNKLFLYYQSGVASAKDRTYRFEVVDEGGFPVAAMDRTISGDSSYSISTSAFNEKSVSVIGSDEVTVTDAGYAQAYHAIPLDTYFSGLPREYLSLSGARLNMVIDMEVLEDYDGYQYIQILANQTNHCDTGAKKGNPGTIGYSRYMAGFSHLDGKRLYQFKKYTFPLVTAGNNCGEIDEAWNDAAHDDNDVGILWQQYFNFNVDQKARADDGRLSVPASVSTLGIRFDASGDDRDDWRARNVTAKIQAAAAAPELLGNPVISAAPSCKGSTLTVSLAFNEIVVVITGDTTLRTTWGDLAYVAGSGSNVLTFSGTITANANTTLEIGGLTGTVRGLSSTTFTWPRTYTTSRRVKAMPTPPREGDVYLLSSPIHLRWFADNLPANATLSAALASDIDLVNADGFSPMGGNVGFNGVFDGRGHAISRLSISSPDSSGRAGFFGLVGAQGVVTNLVLSDVNISCASPTARIGAVCGHNLGTIARCSVSGSVATSSSMNGNGSALGGVCGENGGTVRACRAVSGSSSYLLINRWSNISVGGVAGVNSAAGRLESCYFHARYNEYNYNGITRGAVCGANAGTVRDCVGLHDNNNWFNGCFGSNTGTTNNVPFPLDAAFSGGEACYTLNDGVTDGSQPWYQTVGEDDLPQLSGETVYRHGSVYNNANHIWSFAEFEHSADFSNGVWSVVCTSGGETTTLSATGTCAVTTQPTCTSPGETTWTYIPPANDYGVTATNAVQSGVPAALGHVWGEASYFWAADGSTATASNACTVCGAPLVETVEAVCVVTREPTQTVPGEKSCTATFSSPCFTEQTTVVAIPVLPPPVPYIDADGVERTCPYYTVITSAAGDVTYGTAGKEAWYVVTNDVSIGGMLSFNGSTNHLIVCDGATLAVTNTSNDAIHATYGSLSIYAQAGGTGTLDLEGGDDGIDAANGLTINGGVVNAHGNYGFSSFGITINGGVVNAIGDWVGFWGSTVTLGWRTLTDSITISSFSDDVSVYVKPGQMLTDGANLYTGGPLARTQVEDIKRKTLRPYILTFPYIDADGVERTCPYYTIITNAAGNTAYGTAGKEAWYVVTNDVSIGGTLSFLGSTNHLIVCDGATLAVTNTSGDAIHATYGCLSIYAQAGGTGTLDLNGDDDAIEANSITINGGVVNANGGCGLFPGDSVTINSGVVNVNGSYWAGIYGNCDVILGWRTLTDSITINSFSDNTDIYVKSGQPLTDGTTLYKGGPLDPAAIAGKTLRPYVGTPVPYIDTNGYDRWCPYYTVITNAGGDAVYGTADEEAWYVVTNDVSIGGMLRFNGSTNHLIVCDGATLAVANKTDDAIQSVGSISIHGQSSGTGTLDLMGADDAIQASDVTINGGVVNANGTCNGIVASGSVILGWSSLANSITVSSLAAGGGVYVMPGQTLADEDGNTYTGGPLDIAQIAAIAGKTLRPHVLLIPYIDADGVERLRIYYTIITNAEGGATYGTNGEEAWYVVTNDVSIGGTLSFNGSASHLIVCDGATLDVTNNIVGDAIWSRGSISIYGQAGGTGTLDLNGTDDAIQAHGGITINGGVVNVNGPYGLYPGYDGDITVNGGVVDINAYSSGIWIEGNVTVSLGWRTLTDSITISSFSSSSAFVNVKAGQMLTDGTNLYTGGPIDKDAIAGKTLRPYLSNPPFPSYLDGADDQVKTNYLSWAMRNGYDVNSEHAAAFLLNVVPSATPVEFRIAGIEVGADGATIRVVATADGAAVDLSAINGILAVAASDDLAALVPMAIPAANVSYDAGVATIFVPSSAGTFIQARILVATP